MLYKIKIPCPLLLAMQTKGQLYAVFRLLFTTVKFEAKKSGTVIFFFFGESFK